MPNNELVSFFLELACGSRFIAFSLSYIRQKHLFTGYLNKREANWSRNAPAIVSGIVTRELAVQLLANFFPVSINNPKSLCDG